MKKWLTIAATTALLSSGFAAEQYDQLIAFARGPKQETGKSKGRTKVFFGYKFFVTQPGENETADRYATITETTTNSQVAQNSNYDWDFGHWGTVGVQLPKTMFKVFFEGLIFHNTKRRTIEPGSGFDLSPIDGIFSIGFGFAPTKLKVKSSNDLYFIDFFVSYAAYRKGNFFFIPYVGPRYAHGKHDICVEFSKKNPDETGRGERKIKHEGFGIVMAFTLKYFFTSRFYAFGDYRYSIVFTRQTFVFKVESTLNPSANNLSFLGIAFDTDEIFELAFGFGIVAVDCKNWNLTFDTCYKLIRWGDANQHYQALGLGVLLGF